MTWLKIVQKGAFDKSVGKLKVSLGGSRGNKAQIFKSAIGNQQSAISLWLPPRRA
jgi:hypothetical protein